MSRIPARWRLSFEAQALSRQSGRAAPVCYTGAGLVISAAEGQLWRLLEADLAELHALALKRVTGYLRLGIAQEGPIGVADALVLDSTGPKFRRLEDAQIRAAAQAIALPTEVLACPPLPTAAKADLRFAILAETERARPAGLLVAALEPRAGALRIDGLKVQEVWRRVGLGRAMISALKAHAKSHGASHLLVQTRSLPAEAEDFLASAGFIRPGTEDDGYRLALG